MGRAVLVLSLVCAVGPTRGWSADDLLLRRSQLESVLSREWARHAPQDTALDDLARATDRQLFFLRPLEIRDPALQKLARQFAASLHRLAQRAFEAERADVGYDLLHQAAAFDPEGTAAQVIGAPAGENVRAVVAKTAHPRLGWKRGKYWRVTTDHFQISTNDSAAAGEALALQLESLYRLWRQAFFGYWGDASALRAAAKRGRRWQPTTPKHRVVLFGEREEYVAHLQSREPRIGITLGFYDTRSRSSFFFGGPHASPSTRLHEVGHQLFQETGRVRARGQWQDNFWVIEGIAMYLESARFFGPVATLGGLDADRLQFARYRSLQEAFYVPLAEFVQLGRSSLQEDPRIRRLYSQAAGLAHYFMDGEGGRHRGAMLRYLRAMYDARGRVDTLSMLTGQSLDDLDDGYQQYLQVSDQDLVSVPWRRDSVRSLCLGGTQVTRAGLAAIPPQEGLEWLDLAAVQVHVQDLPLLVPSGNLRQLNLAGTPTTDDAMSRLSAHVGLEELDLSHTPISDRGLAEIASLPRLEILWLNGTQVSGVGLQHLLRLPRLSKLGVEGTQVSAAEKQRLQEARPELVFE